MAERIYKSDLIYLDHYNSPVGTLYLVSDGEYLTGLYMEQRRYCTLDMKKIPVSASLPVFRETEDWLDI